MQGRSTLRPYGGGVMRLPRSTLRPHGGGVMRLPRCTLCPYGGGVMRLPRCTLRPYGWWRYVVRHASPPTVVALCALFLN